MQTAAPRPTLAGDPMTEPEPDIAGAGEDAAPVARVLLADLQGGARRALAALIADIPRTTLVGEVDHAEDIPRALRRMKANVLVIDDRLIHEADDPLAASGPLPEAVRVIVVGIDDSPRFAARAAALGAEAWISKEFADDGLRELLGPP